MSIAIIDYGSGNLRSAAKAFERATDETIVVTTDAAALADASHIVLPGVGAFRDCRDGLAAVPGMMDALMREVVERGKPYLGICVGMQLMAGRGVEHGETPGFGWIPGSVIALKPKDELLKIPHMGWNELSFEAGVHPALAGIDPGAHVYFVHSYGLVADDPAHVLATVDYGGPVTAIVGRDNLIGTQFHPEKSQRAGLRFIQNFVAWKP